MTDGLLSKLNLSFSMSALLLNANDEELALVKAVLGNRPYHGRAPAPGAL